MERSRPASAAEDFTLRTEIGPGDIGWLIHRHGVLYATEAGFDTTFEAYVAGTLGEWGGVPSPRERLWIAERHGGKLGSVAILERSPELAQLRWFLIEPEARGLGLGRVLLGEALAFCRRSGYHTVMLWTEASLAAAAHLYRAAGFEKVEATPERQWGREVVLERYELALGDD